MKKILISMIAGAMMLLSGCDKLKDATSRDISVKNVAFDFETTTQPVVALLSAPESGVTTRAAVTSSFTVTRTVDISELDNDDLEEYANKISKVLVNAALITVTTSPAGDFTVTDLTVVAAGVPGSLVIPSYTIGGVFTAPATMNAYTMTFLTQLLSAKSIVVTVSGQTDAPAGTTIFISYESDVVFTASLF